MFEEEAEERAKKLEESQTLGVYDREEDFERDRGWNEGEVVGYEEGFKDGAEFGFDNAKNKMEKHIAELEQINAELKTVKIPQLERKIASIRGVHSVDCKKLNARLEQCERQKEYIAELEKENAELKETVIKMNNVITETFSNLTKAKEIIAELIRFQPYIDREAMFHRIGNEWERAIYEGIQFLKEVSE